jgi:hypothetical protein
MNSKDATSTRRTGFKTLRVTGRYDSVPDGVLKTIPDEYIPAASPEGSAVTVTAAGVEPDRPDADSQELASSEVHAVLEPTACRLTD